MQSWDPRKTASKSQVMNHQAHMFTLVDPNMWIILNIDTYLTTFARYKDALMNGLQAKPETTQQPPVIGSVAHANNLQHNVSQFYIRPQYPKLIALHLRRGAEPGLQ